MLEGIKLGIVSHIRLDDILDRKEIRQIQQMSHQDSTSLAPYDDEASQKFSPKIRSSKRNKPAHALIEPYNPMNLQLSKSVNFKTMVKNMPLPNLRNMASKVAI